MSLDLITETPDNLPTQASLAPTDIIIVQTPGGPLSKMTYAAFLASVSMDLITTELEEAVATLLVAAIGPSSNYGPAVLDTVYGAPTRAIYIGAAGNLTITRPDNTSVTIPNLPAGYDWVGQAIKVSSASTAGGLVTYF